MHEKKEYSNFHGFKLYGKEYKLKEDQLFCLKQHEDFPKAVFLEYWVHTHTKIKIKIQEKSLDSLDQEKLERLIISLCPLVNFALNKALNNEKIDLPVPTDITSALSFIEGVIESKDPKQIEILSQQLSEHFVGYSVNRACKDKESLLKDIFNKVNGGEASITFSFMEKQLIDDQEMVIFRLQLHKDAKPDYPIYLKIPKTKLQDFCNDALKPLETENQLPLSSSPTNTNSHQQRKNALQA